MADIIYQNTTELPSSISVTVSNTDFAREYSKLYFTDYDKDCENLKCPKGLRRGPEWVEKEIFKVWNKESIDATDIFKILAWKSGKIDYTQCNKRTKTLGYATNWIEGVSFQMRNQEVMAWEHFEPAARDIIKIWSDFREEPNADLAWSELIRISTKQHVDVMKGIGSVYLITLLFFISKGSYPIYDRFAMSALSVWKLKQSGVFIPDGAIVKGYDLPNKHNAHNLLKKGKYIEYKTLLSDFCESEYENCNAWKTNRNVDRELYVYGHFYN